MRPLRGVVTKVMADGRLVCQMESGMRATVPPNKDLTKGDSCWVNYDFTRNRARNAEKPYAWRSETAENAPFEEEIFTGEE